jgi:dGTPase
LLERRYPDYPGLNLTYEVREGIVKHETSSPQIAPDIFPPEERSTLEASLVDLADAVAYNSHDVDDGLSSGILEWAELENVPIWKRAGEECERRYPGLKLKLRRHVMVRFLVDWQVTDLINCTFDNLRVNKVGTLADVRRSRGRLVAFSDQMQSEITLLKRFLNEKMYQHPRMQAMAEEAHLIIETLFDKYRRDPTKLHGKFKLRLENEPVEIIISDFIAGMTDRYAARMYDEMK